MYALLYFDKYYEPLEAFVLAVSYDYEKLSNKLNQLITETELRKSHNKKIQDIIGNEFRKFVVENKEFWERNRHAITNPNRSDGLFIKELTNSNPFSVFAPSGCILLGNGEIAAKVTVKLTDTEIQNIVDSAIHALSSSTDYKHYKYINWDKITEPIPTFSYSYLYDEIKSIGFDYSTNNLSIDYVEVIE